MPDADVTVTATFRSMTAQEALTAAKALIVAIVFELQQDAADTQYLSYRLADLINELIKATGFTVSPYDIVLFNFSFLPAQTSDADNATGRERLFRVPRHAFRRQFVGLQ